MKHIAIGENHLYSKAYAKGSKFVGKHVIVYILKDYSAKRLMLSHPDKIYVNRIGITVSKKLGGAVVRNRIKRILREGLRQTEKENNLKTGYLIVLVARTSCADAKTEDVKRDLCRAVNALKFTNDEKNT